MNNIYDIKNFEITPKELSFEVSDSKIEIPLEQTGSKVLSQTKREYLQIYEIDPDGLGIHWPVVDEDLSIEGLLRSAGRGDLIVKEIPSRYLDEEPEATLSKTEEGVCSMKKA